MNISENEAKDLKERMDREKLPWRSFTYQESVNSQWNPSTPSYYVLDAKGVGADGQEVEAELSGGIGHAFVDRSCAFVGEGRHGSWKAGS